MKVSGNRKKLYTCTVQTLYNVHKTLSHYNIKHVLYFVWFDSLRPINNLSSINGRVFLGWTSTKLGLMCLAQGHKAVTLVRLEPAASRLWVKHSTTALLIHVLYNIVRSQVLIFFVFFFIKALFIIIQFFWRSGYFCGSSVIKELHCLCWPFPEDCNDYLKKKLVKKCWFYLSRITISNQDRNTMYIWAST